MPLEWFRLDTNFATNPKLAAMIEAHGNTGIRAAFGYVCSIGWSVRQETDGYIPDEMVNYQGSTATRVTTTGAALLVKYHLWDVARDGWSIHNFAERQQTSTVANERRREGLKNACKRWHPEGCWTEPDGCSKIEWD